MLYCVHLKLLSIGVFFLIEVFKQGQGVFVEVCLFSLLEIEAVTVSD